MSRTAASNLLLLLLALCAPALARAQDETGNPANWCRNGLFTNDAEGFKLARVAGKKGERVYFYGDDEGCPALSAKCRQKAYVVAGDELIVSRTYGDFACAWFQPANGHETVGWIELARTTSTEFDLNPPLARWLGTWEFYTGSLKITRSTKAGGLSIAGEAFWHGVNPGNVHTGEVDAEGVPAGNTLALGEGDDLCKITLRLVGIYLIADDNGDCGGANVTFDGVYRRKRR
jgi:hypothetical protein